MEANREIKHQIYGKCSDEEFATIFQFAICRLLFNTKRPVFVFVKNVNIYSKFLNRSATINSPVMFYLFFYVN